MAKTLIVMVKVPLPGRVKTRLGREIGMVPAAWWFRHQMRRLFRELADPRWQIILAVSPDRQGLTSRFWPPHLQRIPQGRGDLGQRMAGAMRHAKRGPVCVIGADIPGISRAHIARAFAALGGKNAVFGPADDGGYWLVGLQRGSLAQKDMFAGVRWSSSQALADSIAALKELQIALTDQLSDVDSAADLPGRAQ